MQWIILRLSRFLKNDQIAMCVGVSERAIRSVMSYFRADGRYGTINGGMPVDEEHKQNWHLQDVDVEVNSLSFYYVVNLHYLHLVLTWHRKSTTRLVP